MSEDLLTNLADYSRQPLRVGRPPLYVLNDGNRPQDRELLALSVQLRIAEALERLVELTEKPAYSHCHQCGCTQEDCSQCIEATGEPCTWVTPYLCSRCFQVQKGALADE